MSRLPHRLALLILLTIATALGSITPAAAKVPEGVALWSPGDPDPTYPFSDRYPVAIVTATAEPARAIAQSGIDVESVGLREGQWVVLANVNDAEHADLLLKGHEVYRLRNLALEMYRSLPDEPTRWTNWPTYPQYQTELQAIAAAHPNICRLISIGQSVQGRDLWFLKISDNPDMEEDEPEFKYTSSIHGNEVTGMEMCVRLANLLLDQYGTDPTITSYVNGMEIWICPLHNPDGYVNGTRYNAHGEDLNRNFPDPVDDPDDDPAGHEIETQHFMYFGYDHRFVLSANYHGGALVMNYPWDCQEAYTPDDTMIRNFALGYSYRNPPMWNSPYFENGVTIGWEWYIIYGGMQDWCYNWRSDIDYTIEVSETMWPAYSQMDAFWDDNRDAMLWLMGRCLTGITGLVYDAQTGAPLDATVDVLEIGKSIRTDPEVGDYHRLLEAGTYTLYVEAFGYVPQTIPGIVVGTGPATRVDVPLGHWPVYDISGTVTEEGTGIPLDATVQAYLHATQQLVAETPTDPVTGSYALELVDETYDLRASAEGHIPQMRTITVTGDRVENFALADAGGSILVVQDGATTRIASDLALLGLPVVTETDDLTDPESWSAYRLLIWSAGANLDPVADATIRAALEAYVADGGKLLIEGGQIGYDCFRTPGYPSFGANVLHCSLWDVSDAGNLSIAATGHALVTTPNALPTTLAVSYSGVGDNDAVRLLADATLIYRTAAYTGDAGVLCVDDDPSDAASGQIVFYAFNYNALADAAGARGLLENTVTYLSQPDLNGITELLPGGCDWLGPAFPNPAGRTVHFRLELPGGEIVTAQIFDPQGRRVWELPSVPAANIGPFLTWDGQTGAGRIAPTGIYFLRLQGNRESAGRTFLWLRP